MPYDDPNHDLRDELLAYRPMRLRDEVGALTVSTLAMFRLDWAGRGYETLVLDDSGRDVDEYTNRYHTEAEAREGHAATVAKLREGAQCVSR